MVVTKILSLAAALLVLAVWLYLIWFKDAKDIQWIVILLPLVAITIALVVNNFNAITSITAIFKDWQVRLEAATNAYLVKKEQLQDLGERFGTIIAQLIAEANRLGSEGDLDEELIKKRDLIDKALRQFGSTDPKIAEIVKPINRMVEFDLRNEIIHMIDTNRSYRPDETEKLPLTVREKVDSILNKGGDILPELESYCRSVGGSPPETLGPAVERLRRFQKTGGL